MVEGDILEDGIYYKVCKLCGEKKVRGCFHKNDNYSNGFSSKCKKCTIKNDSGRYRDVDFAKAQKRKYGYLKI